MGDPDLQMRDPDLQMGDPDLQMRDPDLQMRDPDLQMGDPDLQMGDPDLEMGDRISKSEIGISKSTIRTPILGNPKNRIRTTSVTPQIVASPSLFQILRWVAWIVVPFVLKGLLYTLLGGMIGILIAIVSAGFNPIEKNQVMSFLGRRGSPRRADRQGSAELIGQPVPRRRYRHHAPYKT
jgi:hypothetical protein